jgi:hypothetical protein
VRSLQKPIACLKAREILPDPRSQKRTIDGRGGEALTDDYAPLARLLLRAEGIASPVRAPETRWRPSPRSASSPPTAPQHRPAVGRPAHLYVSEELLGLAGSSPLRR